MSRNKLVWLIAAMFTLSIILMAGCNPDLQEDEEEEEMAEEEEELKETDDEGAGVFDEAMTPRLASAEVEGDFMTVWAENFSDYMHDWSGGDFDLTVYPQGTLGDERDINEQAQMGQVEYVFSDYAWSSAFVPEASVFGLHYIWPEENIEEVVQWVVRNGDTMDILEESYRQEDLVPLTVMFEGWQWITSNEPIESMEDLHGVDIRIMDSSMLNEQYLAYDADPTAIEYGEVYSALQTGLIDAQIQPIFANRSMNFYEVQDYLTNLYAEPFMGIPAVNEEFFDSLPEEAQEEMREWWADAITPAAEWLEERHEEDLEYMEEEGLEINELSEEQQEEFRERAEEANEEFFDLGGERAEEIYEALLNDIEQAEEELGIE